MEPNIMTTQEGFYLTVALLSILFFILSIITIKERRGAKLPYGENDNRVFTAKIRAHANYCEYTPLCLILLFVLQTTHINTLFYLSLCFLLLLGRTSHALSLLIFEQKQTPTYRFRVVGMLSTLFMIVISACYLLWHAIISLLA